MTAHYSLPRQPRDLTMRAVSPIQPHTLTLALTPDTFFKCPEIDFPLYKLIHQIFHSTYCTRVRTARLYINNENLNIYGKPVLISSCLQELRI